MKSKDKETKRVSLLSGVSLVAAAAAALTGAPAHAQDAGEDEAIVVTGSRIPQANLVTTSPVTQVTGEDIRTQGVTRVEDLTNDLPQVFASQGSNISNGASGTAEVDLRGLGSQRTLVLVDGRRIGYGSITNSAADLNTIPGALVERVEVLTGGASAVYGSDAVAGVVNFIMRDDFEGVRLDMQYGFNQHSNDSDNGYAREVLAARQATNPAYFQMPPDDVTNGYGQEATIVLGASTEDGRGNITAYAGYRHDAPVLQRDYDYSACTFGADSTAAVTGVPAGARHWTCGGSGTTSPARITSLVNLVDVTPAGPGNAFVPYSSGLHAYNFGPINYYQRPSERYTFGAFGRYEVNENAEVYSNVMFSHNNSQAQIAPSGAFYGNIYDINCGDPNLGATRATTLGCTAPQIAGDQTINVLIGKRNVDGGGRVDDRDFLSYRGVIGVRGPISDNWDYDVSASYSSVRVDQVYRNDFSVQRLSRSLDVVDADPGVGVDPQCRSFVDGSDPNCVPYNIWNAGGVTPDALTYLQTPGVRTGEATQQIFTASITGDTGIGTPWADSNIATAFGVEYRRDAVESDADTAFSTGDLAGQGGPTFGLSGETEVYELFAEASLPLVENAPFAEQLSIDAAYRRSNYENIDTDTYKVGGEWAPTEDIRFRASYQRAVRAANIVELFSSQGAGLFDAANDPCDDINDGGGNNNSIPAQCIGVNPWQVTIAQSDSGLLDNPAGQYNGLFGGNPALDPETAETYTYGVVFTPRFLPGFSMSVDYFDIEVTDLVGVVQPLDTLDACYLDNDLTACSRITRDPNLGALYVNGGIVSALNTNIGGLSTSGVDVNANYSLDIGGAGELGFNLVGTWLESLETDPGSGFPTYDCVGLFAANCGTPNPEWRHRFRVSWETPFDVTFSGTWRYFGGVDNKASTSATDLDRSFDAMNYFDAAAQWQVFESTNLRFGVTNVFDTDPPLSDNVGSGAGNGNTYPQVYDSLGRFVFVGATVDF